METNVSGFLVHRCDANSAPPSETRPIIVTAMLGVADFAWADALRKENFPPERNFLSAHLTLFHHLPPECADEVRALLTSATNVAAPLAQLTSLQDLGRGTAFRVESPGLSAIRAALAAAFPGRLTPQDASPPRLHITVQNKVERPVAQALFARLAATFQPRPLEIAGLAAWRYLGGPWALIGEFQFRNAERFGE